MIYVGIPAYLVVVAFSVRDIVSSHSPPVAAGAFIAVVVYSAAFLWLAFSHRKVSERAVLAAVTVMGAVAALLALLGNTSAVYLAAMAAMAGDSLPPRRAFPFIIAAAAGVCAYSIANGFEAQEIVAQSVITLMVGFFTLGVHRLADTNAALIDAREQVGRLAVANERLRFARDLHDLLGHTLTVIRAKSELASRLAPLDLDKAAREMDEVEALAREALVEVRDTVTGYRRPTLVSEIAHARTALDSAGITADITTEFPDLTTEVDETLGWVLREAVTNVVRHSGAAGCRIEARPLDGMVALEVADDGRGSTNDPGNGLTGARERLALVGGTLELGRSPTGGFLIVARVHSAP
jgi:two-component system sensor histidine kinase DesK